MTAPARDGLRDLELLIRSRYGLIHLATDEEERAMALLHHLADRLAVPFFTWTRTRGLRRFGLKDPVYGTRELHRALDHVIQARSDGLYHLQGVSGPELEPPLSRALLQDAAGAMEDPVGAVVLTGGGLSLSGELAGHAAHLTLPGPDTGEFRHLLGRILRDLSARGHVEVLLSREEVDRLLSHLQGFTLLEAEKTLTKAIVEDRALTLDAIEHVLAAKRRVVEQDGLLEYHPVETDLDAVADMEGFKRWLSARTAVVTRPGKAREMELPFPRGVLLLGVPGCGKSLAAKAVSAEWGLPLLRFDPSTLYNKYIGETEKNFKRAVTTAERMAPVVLWIDELEKAFASGGSEDGGVSQRVLGSFLSWMQERSADVFVMATANDVHRLPPEFLRKGRFDEIFFVDLPDTATRARILRIHLALREMDAAAFPVDALAEESREFSGSELEQAVVAARYAAFAEGGSVTAEHLHREIARTRPLAVVMRERIESLRRWAQDRTVPAN
ncbi:MAG: AAA family ATPase [Gemmatimonadota bacterium]